MNEFKWERAGSHQGRERICLTDMIFLKYGDSKLGSICVEFEYFQQDSSMNYLEICYSDTELERYVESNPSILRNIDAYVRSNLLKQEFNYSFV